MLGLKSLNSFNKPVFNHWIRQDMARNLAGVWLCLPPVFAGIVVEGTACCWCEGPLLGRKFFRQPLPEPAKTFIFGLPDAFQPYLYTLTTYLNPA